MIESVIGAELSHRSHDGVRMLHASANALRRSKLIDWGGEEVISCKVVRKQQGNKGGGHFGVMWLALEQNLPMSVCLCEGDEKRGTRLGGGKHQGHGQQLREIHSRPFPYASGTARESHSGTPTSQMWMYIRRDHCSHTKKTPIPGRQEEPQLLHTLSSGAKEPAELVDMSCSLRNPIESAKKCS